MKKLLVLVGVAAAAYGAKKVLSRKEQETSAAFGATDHASNAYAPQLQDEQAA